MAITKVEELGRVGLVLDRSPYALPANAFNQVRNLRFREGGMEPVQGYDQIFNALQDEPYYIQQFPPVSSATWVYLSLTDAYAVDTNWVHSKITRVDGSSNPVPYNASTNNRWTGGMIGGVPFFNNFADVPQMWTNISGATNLQDMDNWPSNLRCKVMRPFRNFLFALGVEASGALNPQTLRVSHPAAPGEVPASWDPTDTTKQVFEQDLAETSDNIVDAMPIGDLMVIYKEKSTWGMQFVGGNNLWRIFKIHDSFGMLAPWCGISIPQGHIVASQSDIILHNGQRGSERSLIQDRVRRWLFGSMNETRFNQCFFMDNPRFNEVMFCFPSGGSDWPNEALIINTDTGAIGHMELPEVTFGTSGTVPEEQDNTDTWDGGPSLTWNEEDEQSWGAATLTEAQEDPVICNLTNGGGVYQIGSADSFDGSPIDFVAERLGIPITLPDGRGGHKAVDPGSVKLVKGVFPLLDASEAVTFQFRLGVQQYERGPVDWSDLKTFTLGDQEYVDVLKTGRFVAIRIEGSTSERWRLVGLHLDVEVAGSR